MTKRQQLNLGSNKAIQAVACELNDDGSARFGVVVLVPVAKDTYKPISVVLPITDVERRSIIALLEGKLTDGTQGTSADSPREGTPIVAADSGHTGNGGPRGTAKAR